MVGLSALTGLTGCQMGGGGSTANTAGPRFSEPSGGGAAIAEERPGAGVGAQTSMGASADVPEATQKGAGASNLTEPGESASSSGQTAAGAAETPGGTASASASAPATPSAGANTTQLSATQGTTNMAIPLYQEQLQVGKRDVNDGAVRIRKYVTTETVNQPVQIRREQVTVDRVPAGQQAAAATAAAGATNAANAAPGQPFQEQDIVIQLHHEEPVVSKQVQPEGEVVANLRTETLQTNVQGQVRRDQVQVTKQGNPQNVIIGQNLATPGGAPEAMGGSSQPGSSQTQGAGAGGPAITDAQTLTGASDPSQLAGRQAQLSDLKVEQVVGQHLLVVSDRNGKPLYVRVNQPMPNLQPGDRVNLSGTVNRVPSSPSQLGLDQQASQTLQGQSVYVDAQQVEPASQQ